MQRYFLFFMLRSPRSTVAAVIAKNSPQDCFLNALAVLKEIILSQLGLYEKSPRRAILRGFCFYMTLWEMHQSHFFFLKYTRLRTTIATLAIITTG